MRFDIRLVAYIKSVLVAKFIEPPLLRVVTTTYGVDIMSFHVVEIFTHIRFAKHVSCLFVMFVVISSLDQYGTTVYQELITSDFQFAEAYPERNNFGRFSRLLDTES